MKHLTIEQQEEVACLLQLQADLVTSLHIGTRQLQAIRLMKKLGFSNKYFEFLPKI